MPDDLPDIRLDDDDVISNEPNQYFLVKKRDGVGSNELAALFADKVKTWRPGDSLDAKVGLTDKRQTKVSARVLVATCERQHYWSIAARINPNEIEPPNQKAARERASREARSAMVTSDVNLTWKPSKDDSMGPLTIEYITNGLWNLLQRRAIDKGLIVVSGCTSAGKSNVAEGLLYNYLCSLNPNDGHEVANCSHVLTVEAPLVNPLCKGGSIGDRPISRVSAGRNHVIQATRRALSPLSDMRDAHSLGQILVFDARRQNPEAVYVDEVRHDNDWPAIIDFALTRQLVVATTHASSLPETIARIMRACGCSEAADRARVARAILGAIHLTSREVRQGADYRVIVPAVWRNSKTASRGLAWPGESSMLPRAYPPDRVPEDAGTFGRVHFVKAWRARLLTKSTCDEYSALLRWAIESDLQEY